MSNNIIRNTPNSLEAEEAVLACIMLDEDVPLVAFSCIDESDFYSNANKLVFLAMAEIYNSNAPVDIITVVNKLESTNKLEEAGGIDYITSITNFLPSGANFKYYLDILKNHSRRRQLIKASQEIIDTAFSLEDGKEVMNFAEKMIFDISQKEDLTSLEHISKGLPDVMENLEKLAQNKGKLRGIDTGFKDLDAITNGWQNSDLVILAARPGVGKTTFALNTLNHASVNLGKSCAIFSLEMPTSQLIQRSLCSIGAVNMGKVLCGSQNETEWQKLWLANKKLNESKIFIDDNSMNTAMDILSKCRRLKRERGLDLVMIDYLQLMESETKERGTNRTLQIGEITRKLKIAAKELNVPIILLSQLSRQVEQREDHRPVLSDLRDSGSIEQDADIVMFLYNPDKYNDNVKQEGTKGMVELEIAKHRNGETGTIKLKLVSSWLRFFDKDARVEDETLARTETPQQNEEDFDENYGENPAENSAEEIKSLENLTPPPEEE